MITIIGLTSTFSTWRDSVHIHITTSTKKVDFAFNNSCKKILIITTYFSIPKVKILYIL